MKKQIILSIILLAILTGSTLANIMPFGVAISTTGGNLQVTYRLNETCSAVTVQICGPLPATTVVQSLVGTTNFGANTVTWAWSGGDLLPTGSYGVKVQAVDAVGHSAWTKISNDAAIPFMFFTGRGMKVNKNAGSPYMGLIYYGNTTAASTVSGRPCTKGIYAVYPDGSDPFNQGNTAATGGIDWTMSANSPYQLFIGPDDKVWMSDWADAHSGVWRAENADLSGTFTLVLDTTGAESSGLVPGLHGSITGILVEGIGTNTVLYTSDEDLVPTLSIYKYDVGNGPFPWTTPPTTWVDKSVHTFLVNHSGMNIYHDSQGRWWVNNYRASSDYPTLIAFSADRQTVVWDSKTIGNDGSNDPLFGCVGGYVIDEARNRVIVSGYNAINSARSGFTVFPFDPLPTGNLSSVTTQVAVDSTTIRAIDVDLAGNVITMDSNNEIIRIYSPPDGPNSFTTECAQNIANGDTFTVSPLSPITMTAGQTKDFTASGGVPPYTWSLSTTGVGTLDTTAGAAVTFTATGAGSVDLTVTDSRTPTAQQIITSITVLPTGAPLFKEIESRKYIRFELFD